EDHQDTMSVQLRLPSPPPLHHYRHNPVSMPSSFSTQEMRSNHQTSRKSNIVIFPAERRCHSSRPSGQGQFDHEGETGDLFDAIGAGLDGS
ncbi:Hypothetical predicted protein, partial [Xyrichtys novacula]